jgi:hypothetical protein
MLALTTRLFELKALPADVCVLDDFVHAGQCGMGVTMHLCVCVLYRILCITVFVVCI